MIVVDIGKTMSKVTLWSRAGKMLDRRVRANRACEVDGVRRLDVNGIAEWLVEALAASSGEPVEFIIPVGHGAGVVALSGDRIALPPLDYEQPIAETILAAYRSERDPFAITGSPALPDGLNFGAQLYWLDSIYPAEMSGATFVPWAQYWAWFLSGIAVSEPTSLGCHSDVWSPGHDRYSPLAERMGWADRFAPLASAGETIGTIRSQLASKTGLPPSVRVLAGLHDSNAALLAARGYAEIGSGDATVLSTGTWFVAMRLPCKPIDLAGLPDDRDCLVNVDVYRRPVPSARFMGGREIETLIELDTRRIDIKPDQPALLAAIPSILDTNTMVLPTLAPGCGPFPRSQSRWLGKPEDWFAKRTAASLYAALVADISLNLIGSQGPLLIEGRFAEAEVFTRALASLRPDAQVFAANAHNDVSFGALRLIDPDLRPTDALRRVAPLDLDVAAYRSRWLAQIGGLA